MSTSGFINKWILSPRAESSSIPGRPLPRVGRSRESGLRALSDLSSMNRCGSCNRHSVIRGLSVLGPPGSKFLEGSTVSAQVLLGPRSSAQGISVE